MSVGRNQWKGFSVTLLLLLSLASALACSVPVFRYALEKWPPDVYQATVFHRGPLTSAQQALVQTFLSGGA